MTDDKLVEAMAQAIYDDCHGWFNPVYGVTSDDMRDTARAALEAYRNATQDDGK